MAFGYKASSAHGVTNTTGTPATCAYGVNASVGDLLIFCVRFNGTTPGTITVNDTLGNTYSLVPGWPITLVSLGWMYMYYAISGSAGACTASFAYTGTTEECDMVTAIYTGMSATPFDKTANAVGTGTSTDSGATATTSNANEVLIGLATDSNGLCTFTAGTNLAYTLRIQQNTVFSLEDVNVASTGQYHATGTMSPSTTWQQAIVTFMAAATTFSISGNAGVAGANVAYSGAASGNVTADGSGNYTISGLANGSYTITPSLTGYTFSPTSANETVSGSNITGVNFTATQQTVATPTFNPVAGTYAGTQNVTISSTSSGLAGFAITYTTDGSTPVPGSHGTVYSGPVPVSISLTLKAVASATGFLNSSVGSAAYIISAGGAAYSVPDCRDSYCGLVPVTHLYPNGSRTVQGTKIYDVETSNNPAVPPTDSRKAGAPVDSRVSSPQNSRTPGTYGPGE
jgi:hypothetical protein